VDMTNCGMQQKKEWNMSLQSTVVLLWQWWNVATEQWYLSYMWKWVLSILELKHRIQLNSMTAISWNESYTLIRPLTSAGSLGPILVDVPTFFSPTGLFLNYFAIPLVLISASQSAKISIGGSKSASDETVHLNMDSVYVLPCTLRECRGCFVWPYLN
jgi:hypothetical protein